MEYMTTTCGITPGASVFLSFWILLYPQSLHVFQTLNENKDIPLANFNC